MKHFLLFFALGYPKIIINQKVKKVNLKMKKVIYSLLGIALITGVIYSCKKEINLTSLQKDESTLISVKSTSLLDDDRTIDKLLNNYRKLNRLKSDVQINTDSIIVVDYNNSDLTGLIIPFENRKYYTTFIKNDSILDFGVFINFKDTTSTIEQKRIKKNLSLESEKISVVFTNTNGEEIGGLAYVNKKGNQTIKYLNLAAKNRPFEGQFEKCMVEKFTYLSNPQNWMVSTFCMLNGPECAAIMIMQCAARASYNY